MLKALRVLGIIAAAAGLIGIGVGVFKTSAMIVALGVGTIKAIAAASYITLGAGVALTAAGTIPAVVGSIRRQNDNRLLESRRQAEQKNFSEYAKDSLNPEKTRVRLEQLRKNNPKLSNLVDCCYEQMDRIDTYQARHRTLLDANEAIYLEDTVEVLDRSEIRMCQNFRNIINCCILIENTDKGTEELDQRIINAAFADNEEELKSIATLLNYCVAYINNYNRNGVSDRSELDAWLKIMKSSMGEK